MISIVKDYLYSDKAQVYNKSFGIKRTKKLVMSNLESLSVYELMQMQGSAETYIQTLEREIRHYQDRSNVQKAQLLLIKAQIDIKMNFKKK